MATIPDPLAAVPALAPLITAQAEASERDRRLPTPVSDALVEAGVFRLFVPRSLGGLEADPLTACRVVEALAALDGAVGWCAMIGLGFGQFAGLLPAAAALEVFSSPRTIVAGTFRPTGVARVVAGGYRVTGRWPFASGITHCTWVIGGCRLLDGEQPRLTARGTPVLRELFFRPDEVEVLDTWHVTGLRGTGSHDFTVTDVFVPQARGCWFADPPQEGGPLYRLPIIATFAALIGCVSLGIARHALDAFKDLAGVKTPTWSQTTLRAKATAQSQVGEAEGLLRAGRAFLYETVSAAWETVQRGASLSWEQRGLLWLAATQAAAQAGQAVELLYKGGGASSIYATLPLDRCLRDIRTAAQHLCVTPTNYELAGQYFMGLEMGASVWALDYREDGATAGSTAP
jgi:indole-3-acetate monooxygenase